MSGGGDRGWPVGESCGSSPGEFSSPRAFGRSCRDRGVLDVVEKPVDDLPSVRGDDHHGECEELRDPSAPRPVVWNVDPSAPILLEGVIHSLDRLASW